MICLVLALPAEAKPLISHYALKMLSQDKYPVYGADEIRLVISGVGKQAAAAVCHYLDQKIHTTEFNAWLNIGIAGHRDLSIGECRLANKITDNETQRNWYPPQIATANLPSCSLITVATPETQYTDNALYDMEASGFYSVTTSYTTSELAQVCKIVSDNKDSGSITPNVKRVSQLIEHTLEEIDQLVNALQKAAQQLNHAEYTPYYKECLARYHFTVTQQHQLKHLLKRLSLLTPVEAFNHDTLFSFDTAKKLLAYLTLQCETVAHTYHFSASTAHD